MKKLLSFLLVAACFTALGSLYWQNQKTEAQIAGLHEHLLAVQTDNAQLKQSLAKDTKSQQTDDAVHKELEKAVEGIHLLKFSKPIQYHTMKSADFKAFMTKRINEVYTKDEMEMYSRAMAVL